MHNGVETKRYRNREYSTLEDLVEAVERYFEMRDRQDKYYTKSGLMLFLEVTKKRFVEMENDPTFAPIMEWADKQIEHQRNEMLLRCRGNPAGIIFDLKKNHNWKEDNVVRVEGAGFRMVVELASEKEQKQ